MEINQQFLFARKHLFSVGGSGAYRNGLSQLPITYWQDEKLMDMDCYPQPEPTKEESLYNSIYDLFKDKKRCIIVTDYCEPYVFVGREKEICVYDKDKKFIKTNRFYYGTRCSN